ncbi:short-chain dehydrogenase/reductase [Streptomyces pristinaespiralis]|uniref:short-chain dehydrogenase/reductase n=1 Tax=Streptomyces pristinaespiralis TaxID=38300 RepID=UPI0033ECB43A
MAEQSPLLGRTAVVTGAARGIGEAVARTLARRGARVALLGLEEPLLARVAASLPGAAHWPVDVTDEQAMTRTAAQVEESLGPVSVVVANAGVAAGGPFLQTSTATWRRIVEVDLLGTCLTAQVHLPGLLRTRGYFLQVASLAAIAPAPMMSAYCAAKSGAEAFAHSLRAEVAHRGVGVGVGYLSWADTEMIRAAEEHRVMRELRAALPWPAGKVYPVQPVADRLVHGIERRAPAVYAQPWLRLARAARGWLPGTVALGARLELGRLRGDEGLEPTGLLGAGGAAAWTAAAAARQR